MIKLVATGLLQGVFSEHTAIELQLDEVLETANTGVGFPFSLSTSEQVVEFLDGVNRVVAEIDSA